jgi:membrane peptidoglycan carboxypeptidase
MILSITKTTYFLRFLYTISTQAVKNDFKKICLILSSIPDNIVSSSLVDALIIAEDRRFYKHAGIDARAIFRAIWSTLFRGRLQGASTIEQQLVRTITSRYELSLTRKIREFLLSLMVASVYTKQQIAQTYLSLAYFGWQMNGIDQACNRLKYDPHNLTVYQAANVIARIRYPEPEVASQNRKTQIQNRTRFILRKLRITNNYG